MSASDRPVVANVPPRIVLIGMRASGKTHVAAALARRLGRVCIDTDRSIADARGQVIADIFKTLGEPAFRELEAAALAAALQSPEVVISAGGGAVLREDSRALLEAAYCIWLTAEERELARRMSADAVSAAQRPALLGGDPLAEIGALLAKRAPIYRALARLTIATDGKTIDEIVTEILAKLPR